MAAAAARAGALAALPAAVHPSVLGIFGCSDPRSWGAVVGSIASFRSLEILDLRGAAGLRDAHCDLICRRCPDLKVVDLSGAAQCTDAALLSLATLAGLRCVQVLVILPTQIQLSNCS